MVDNEEPDIPQFHVGSQVSRAGANLNKANRTGLPNIGN